MRKLRSSRRIWLEKRVRRQKRLDKFLARCGNLRKKKDRDVVVAPNYFSLIQNGAGERNDASEKFFDFLRKIRNFNGDHICIDMTYVGRLVVNATLLFKAEIAHLSAKGVKISGKLPRKERTHQVLTQTGLTKLLNLPECTQVDREDTVHWRHASGVWNRAQPQKLAALLSPEQVAEDSTLYTGMIESVANCIEHAYKEHPARRVFEDGQDGWWGFQQYRDGMLSTCICDLGIGISGALPISMANEPDLYRTFQALFRKHKGADIRSILAAVEYGRSSTGATQRGKGLRDAHRVIDDAGEGRLHIFSNAGLYFYQRHKGRDKAEVGTKRLVGSIAGTIYFWCYPVQLLARAGASPAEGDVV